MIHDGTSPVRELLFKYLHLWSPNFSKLVHKDIEIADLEKYYGNKTQKFRYQAIPLVMNLQVI